LKGIFIGGLNTFPGRKDCKVAIDKRSSEFMFGQILAQLKSGDKKFDELHDELKTINTKMGDLPCEGHVLRVKNMEEWQEKHDKRAEHYADNRLSLKQGVIIAIITGLIAISPNIFNAISSVLASPK